MLDVRIFGDLVKITGKAVFRLKSGDSVNLFKKREGEAKMDLPEITAEAGLVCETLALFRREGRALCPTVSILGQEGTVCVKFQVEVRRRLRFSFSDKRKVEEASIALSRYTGAYSPSYRRSGSDSSQIIST